MEDRKNIAEADVRARVPKELRARLDLEVERLKQEMPGVAWNQSAVIRRCLEQGLPDMEVTDEQL